MSNGKWNLFILHIYCFLFFVKNPRKLARESEYILYIYVYDAIKMYTIDSAII